MGSRAYAEEIARVIDSQCRRSVIGQRIICREDSGRPPPVKGTRDDYKKRPRAFAPVPFDMTLTVDDTPEIWENMVECHRVGKFLFWPLSDSATAATNAWPPKDPSSNDNALSNLTSIFEGMHEVYFSPKLMFPLTCHQILAFWRKAILGECHITFSGIFPRSIVATSDRHWKFATAFGAKCSKDYSEALTTHVVCKDSVTQKVTDARKHGKRFVRVNWLFQSMANFCRANEDLFTLDLRNPSNVSPMSNHAPVISKEALVNAFFARSDE